jgi:hypothetical protein
MNVGQLKKALAKLPEDYECDFSRIRVMGFSKGESGEVNPDAGDFIMHIDKPINGIVKDEEAKEVYFAFYEDINQLNQFNNLCVIVNLEPLPQGFDEELEDDEE